MWKVRLCAVAAESETKIADLNVTVATQADSNSFTQGQLEDIKWLVFLAKHQLSVAEDRIVNREKCVQVLNKQLDYLDNQSRKTNIHTDGLQEDPGENWEQREQKLLDFITQSLDLPSIQVEMAHRTSPN